MKNKIKITIILLIGTLLLVTINACSDSAEGENLGNEESNEPSVYVKTVPLEHVTFYDQIKVFGVAKAINQADISTDEGGKIKEFVKDKGSYVNKDDVILILDNDVLKANLDAALAQYERAQSNFTRQEKVYKENVISEITYLNAKYDRDAAKANYDLIKARYDRTFIKAPFAGIVDKKYAEVGETILPGVPVVSVVNMYKIKIEAGVPENYVNRVQMGDSVKVVFKDLQNAEYKAVLSYVGNTITTNNRTFPIEITINNSDRKIKPELSAQVYIQEEKYDAAILIPEETVTKTDLGHTVFIEEDGIAKMRIVEIISRSNNKIAVSSGLKEGENLIYVGFQNLVDGTKVKVVN